MRKESLSKQPHKVRSYQASMKEEVEWEKLVDSTVAFACLKRLPRHREDGPSLSPVLGQQFILFHNSYCLGMQMNCR